jgi:Emfourin
LASSSDDIHLSFKRTGGWSPRALELEVDQRDLSPEEAAGWAQALASEPPPPTGGSEIGGDQQQYDVTVRRGDEARTMRFSEFDVPENLTGLVRGLERRAEEQARRQAQERRRR